MRGIAHRSQKESHGFNQTVLLQKNKELQKCRSNYQKDVKKTVVAPREARTHDLQISVHNVYETNALPTEPAKLSNPIDLGVSLGDKPVSQMRKSGVETRQFL